MGLLKSKVAISVGVFVSGVIYALVQLQAFYSEVMPEMKAQRGAVERQLAAKESDLRRLKDFAQNIDAVKGELRELNLQLESALESMPRTFNLSGLLRKLNLLAQNSGVELASFKPSDVTAAPAPLDPAATAAKAKLFYSPIQIQFQVKGTYTQTLVFFDQVTRLKRIINLNQLKFAPTGAGNSAADDKRGAARTRTVATEATIETYRFSE